MLVKYYFLSINPCQLLLITFSSFMCLEIVSKNNCSIKFPGTDMWLTSLQLPRSSFLCFLKIGVTFSVFQSSETSPDHIDLVKIIDSHISVISATSLSTHGCNPLGPTEWGTSSLFKCSLTWSFCTEYKTRSWICFLFKGPGTPECWSYWWMLRQTRHLGYQSFPCHLS